MPSTPSPVRTRPLLATPSPLCGRPLWMTPTVLTCQVYMVLVPSPFQTTGMTAVGHILDPLKRLSSPSDERGTMFSAATATPPSYQLPARICRSNHCSPYTHTPILVKGRGSMQTIIYDSASGTWQNSQQPLQTCCCPL